MSNRSVIRGRVATWLALLVERGQRDLTVNQLAETASLKLFLDRVHLIKQNDGTVIFETDGFVVKVQVTVEEKLAKNLSTDRVITR